MNKAKRKRLEAKGWKFGTADEFLGLTPEESAYLDLKLTLSGHVRALRQKRRLTQVELARRLKSSQSRIAKLEAGDASVSIDLLVRTLIALGLSQKDLARMLADRDRAAHT